MTCEPAGIVRNSPNVVHPTLTRRSNQSFKRQRCQSPFSAPQKPSSLSLPPPPSLSLPHSFPPFDLFTPHQQTTCPPPSSRSPSLKTSTAPSTRPSMTTRTRMSLSTFTHPSIPPPGSHGAPTVSLVNISHSSSFFFFSSQPSLLLHLKLQLDKDYDTNGLIVIMYCFMTK